MKYGGAYTSTMSPPLPSQYISTTSPLLEYSIDPHFRCRYTQHEHAGLGFSVIFIIIIITRTLLVYSTLHPAYKNFLLKLYARFLPYIFHIFFSFAAQTTWACEQYFLLPVHVASHLISQHIKIGRIFFDEFHVRNTASEKEAASESQVSNE